MRLPRLGSPTVVFETGLDYFGELAALDWGAGFGYPRLATVTATAPLRLVVLPVTRFQALMQQMPEFERQIRQAVRERLPTL